MKLDCSSLYRLLNSEDAEEAYSCLHTLLHKDPLLLKGLDLSKREPKHIQVKQLSALLKDPHFRLEKLTLYKSGSITGRDCADLISALTVNPSHLRELDLYQNELDQSGVQKLYTLLMNPHCKLEKLKLNTCSIGEEGCADLTSALTSNPSHLRELDLRGNDKLGDSVKALSKLLQTSGCKLLLDRSLWGKFKGVFFGLRGNSETSETKDGALPAKTREADTGGQQITQRGADESNHSPMSSGVDEKVICRPPTSSGVGLDCAAEVHKGAGTTSSQQ
ncbi:hypothetical protein NFI96_021616 [Prochilodus magdalenae]|nr:hypothetical protein NFI96_021616 [Prochilodus magdalenae]